MKVLDIKRLNDSIPYNEGKIIWEAGKGYTSNLMKSLYSSGFYASTSGACHYLNDNKGNRLCTAYSWLGLLKEAAIIMR